MVPVIRLFRTHPFALTSFILYIFLWCRYLWIQLQFESITKGMNEGNRLVYGEGIGYLMLLVLLINTAFTIIILIYAAFSKRYRRFYLILSILVMLPILIFALL